MCRQTAGGDVKSLLYPGGTSFPFSNFGLVRKVQFKHVFRNISGECGACHDRSTAVTNERDALKRVGLRPKNHHASNIKVCVLPCVSQQKKPIQGLQLHLSFSPTLAAPNTHLVTEAQRARCARKKVRREIHTHACSSCGACEARLRSTAWGRAFFLTFDTN
jgi:ribosomal protein L37E